MNDIRSMQKYYIEIVNIFGIRLKYKQNQTCLSNSEGSSFFLFLFFIILQNYKKQIKKTNKKKSCIVFITDFFFNGIYLNVFLSNWQVLSL